MAEVKICGLSTPEAVHAATRSGARYVGFVFFDKSPRNVSAATARELAWEVPPGIAKVGLFVNPSDDALRTVLDGVPLDFIQLHKVETAERVSELRAIAGLPVIAAAPVSSSADVSEAQRWGASADMLLFDAKPSPSDTLPGGNGSAFDWTIMNGQRIRSPWMLAGGLTPDNVGRAIALTGARIVDVSSGVESAKGLKDPALISAFCRAALAA